MMKVDLERLWDAHEELGNCNRRLGNQIGQAEDVCEYFQKNSKGLEMEVFALQKILQDVRQRSEEMKRLATGLERICNCYSSNEKKVLEMADDYTQDHLPDIRIHHSDIRPIRYRLHRLMEGRR